MASIKLLGVSGSLRQQSFNSALLRAAALLLPDEARLEVYDGLSALPLFSPDVEAQGTPAAVARWQAALKAADGVVFSTPEYAHGVPGAFKNALDWVVGSGELVHKPMVLLGASSSETGADKAAAQVFGTLRVMTGDLVGDGPLCVGSIGRKLADGQVSDELTREALRVRLHMLLARIKVVRAAGSV
ncbi:NADPH-dependent FMN reductase [Silvimonas iriomotensis]|uniref:NADPH-dependent FMN reductase-like domain-containing protein n=1 Tax=Silvimonas iriomotensis TaxID=449662 RepID=A0ABQ2P988_9NEIS|nr:NADPH-dependent FMN reductase [Silvimonas iriomotensis]GGP21153.1 hypothetical protein GCM10010970_19080 [Silvimonas iriomotensis]